VDQCGERGDAVRRAWSEEVGVVAG
jgi:hypothetical protein